MKVAVQLFAQLRDLSGAGTLRLDLADDSTVSDLLKALYEKFPALRAQDKTILVAVGVEFVDRSHKLKAGDEIAIMPPVQGG